jgi:phage gpG-like protein
MISDEKIRIALIRIGSVLQAKMRQNIGRQKLIDTGNLLNSIQYMVENRGDTIRLRVGSFGVPYAAIHEFGYQGPQTVPAHRRMMSIAFGKPMKNPRKVNISAHIRQQNIPARPFVRPAIKSSSDWIIQTLRAAMK